MRFGAHVSSSGGISNAIGRGTALGCESLQVFTHNPRTWKPINHTPEQIAARHDKAKKVLNDFTTMTDMPWPQYYDGKFWKNDLSTRFGIASIPAMFLIDQDGRIVSTEARGPKLEAEIKRLLKL